MDTDTLIPRSRFEIPATYQVSQGPRRDPPFPWTTVATVGLIAMLLLVAAGMGVVEWAFAQRRKAPHPAD